MSAPRFYFDEDSGDAAVVHALRQGGIDVETVDEAGLRQTGDDRQIAHVLANRRVLITGDHRLRGRMEALTRQGGHHPGVLFLHANQRYRVGAIIQSIQLIHIAYRADELIDHVEFIPY